MTSQADANFPALFLDAVRCVAVLDLSPVNSETGSAVTHGLAVHIAERIDRTLSDGSRKAARWWKRFVGA